MRIYVASSWKNPVQQSVVGMLREAGHKVYDFRNPPHKSGFKWQDACDVPLPWTVTQYKKVLASPISSHGYLSDFRAMEWADACVLVLPCGRSAHLEAGWFAGRGKRVLILTQDYEEPELMALMASNICETFDEVLEALRPHGRRGA